MTIESATIEELDNVNNINIEGLFNYCRLAEIFLNRPIKDSVYVDYRRNLKK